MRKWINTVLLAVVISLVQVSDAEAGDDTQQLKEFYSAYKTALSDGEFKHARALADEAWTTSENTMGASKQTGDFAYNYAVLAGALSGSKRNKRAEKAFERSLELANLHGEKTSIITLQRQLEYGKYWSNRGKHKKAAEIFNKAEQLAQSASLTETKPYALVMYEKSRQAYRKKKYQDTKSFAQASLNVFEALNISSSKDMSKAIYMLALADTKLENWREAILGFETVYTNADKTLPENDIRIGRAYLMHSTATRGYMQENGLTYDDYEKMQALNECPACWPNFDQKYEPYLKRGLAYKFERFPPRMPSSARSSAFVVLIFDTDDSGKPVNIRIIERSHKSTFDAASITAVKKWNVTELDSSNPAKQAKDLATIMTFMLTDEGGRLLDFYGRPIRG